MAQLPHASVQYECSVFPASVFVKRYVSRSPAGTDIDILAGDVGEVGTVEAAMGCCVGGVRLGHGDRDAGLLARDDLLALVVALVGNRLDVVAGHYFPRRMRHHRQGVAIVAEVRHLVRDDQVMLGLDGTLHIVADDAGFLARRRHRAGIGIGQRDLRLAADVHALLDSLQGVRLSPAVGQLLDRARQSRLGHRHAGLAHHLVGAVELGKIPRDSGIDLAQPSLELLSREALRLGVDGFELAAVDRDDAGVQQIEAAAKSDELPAYLADRRAIVAAEVGDGFEIGRQTARSARSARDSVRHSRSSPRDDCTWLR